MVTPAHSLPSVSTIVHFILQWVGLVNWHKVIHNIHNFFCGGRIFYWFTSLNWLILGPSITGRCMQLEVFKGRFHNRLPQAKIALPSEGMVALKVLASHSPLPITSSHNRAVIVSVRSGHRLRKKYPNSPTCHSIARANPWEGKGLCLGSTRTSLNLSLKHT